MNKCTKWKVFDYLKCTKWKEEGEVSDEDCQYIL